MRVTRQDIEHVADLARLGLEPDRADQLARELGEILAHMDVLAREVPDDTPVLAGPPGSSGNLRPDEPSADVLRRSREAMAPEMREGFFLVPRLAVHEDSGA